jgi:hypothetical protein
MEGCVLLGKQGDGVAGQWQVVSKEASRLPGTTAAMAAASGAEEAKPARGKGGKGGKPPLAKKAKAKVAPEPADVVYVEGDLPCCITLSGVGAKGGATGGAGSRALWAGHGSLGVGRRLTVLGKPTGDGGIVAGQRITDGEGKVRAWAVGALAGGSPGGEPALAYTLDPSTPGGVDRD